MKKFLIKYIGNPKVFTFSLMWLIILVFVGTINQKWYGLYQVQIEYFTNWIKWFGYIPTPSAKFIMFLMSINLSCYFLRSGIWKINRLGITITHTGVMALLIGSGITHMLSYEGNMYIKEDSSSNYILDTYVKELAIEIESENSDSLEYILFDEQYLKSENILEHDSIPFKIEIIDYFTNCEVYKREKLESNFKGFLSNVYLEKIESNVEYEQNIPGVIFNIISEDSIIGTYAEIHKLISINSLFRDESENSPLVINEKIYNIYLRPKRTYLPFELALIDFRKEYYPGTEEAKTYESKVFLEQLGEIDIKMNEPLRLNGYTFYQASFVEDNITVLAVVKNYGRLFPYISSIIMSVGILFHLFVMLFKRFRK